MRSLTSWESIQPLVGASSESADLDFKETLNPNENIEFAKDVASLANTLGGHILVGVSTDMKRTRCTGFHGIDRNLATTITETFEKQVKERCLPSPIFNVRSLDMPDSPKVVVVLAVEPSARAPIGVLLRQPNAGQLVDKGWAFPYRVGSLTEYLHPDQFGVYESMTARRAAAILRSIPQNERGTVSLRWTIRGTFPGNGWGDGQRDHIQLESIAVQFVEVDLLGNAASFNTLNEGVRIEIPLDQIQTVWRTAKGWVASISGCLQPNGGALQYWPPA